MKPRERMIATLRQEPVDRPPHFEHMFELEHEAFGLRFPPREAWSGATGDKRKRMVDQCMAVYARIIDEFRWDALAVYWPWSDPEAVAVARRQFGDRILVGTLLGGVLWSIDTIQDWEAFAVDLFENPAALHETAEANCRRGLDHIDRLADAGAEIISLVHDVAYNSGPFCSKSHFDELVTPYLGRLVERVKERGMFCIVHSDGNLMPILDSLLSTKPTMLHSLDPMAGMDIAEVRRQTRGQVALMGNVRCDVLEQGPPEAIEASAHYCLASCGHEPGYVFSSSNTIFPGVPLENYRRMLDVYHGFCNTALRTGGRPAKWSNPA